MSVAVDDFGAQAFGRCRGSKCGKPILWGLTRDGNLMPLDPTPDDRGNVEIVGVNRYGYPILVVHADPPLLTQGPIHMPHHATCTSVEEFRR